MITHLEPDILECEVKWALGSITTNKARGGDGIPVELLQILKLSSGHRTRKGQFSFQYKRMHIQCTQKDLHDPDNHDGMISHLEPEILKCEVKWALGSITTNKASISEGILGISNPKR